MDIGNIELKWEAAYSAEYEVQVSSDDGSTWTTVFTEKNGNGGTDIITNNNLGGATISSQYLRLNFLRRSMKRYGHSLWEVEVYGPTPTDPPIVSIAPSMSSAPYPPPGSIPVYQDPSYPISERVQDLLDTMTLQEKVGQMTQVERRQSLNNIQDIATYHLGSLLSGGGSAPDPNNAQAWADMHDSYQTIAMQSRLKIPLIYGVDAVHGHSNVIGATIFPHNIGLGATRNASLVEEIGKITAKEVYATGIRWNFSPCVSY